MLQLYRITGANIVSNPPTSEPPTFEYFNGGKLPFTLEGYTGYATLGIEGRKIKIVEWNDKELYADKYGPDGIVVGSRTTRREKWCFYIIPKVDSKDIIQIVGDSFQPSLFSSRWYKVSATDQYKSNFLYEFLFVFYDQRVSHGKLSYQQDRTVRFKPALPVLCV